MITQKLQHKIDFKTKPLGSLGQLETIALQIGTIQNSLTPQLTNPTIIVFAGDHGITDEGVSPFPKDVTWQMVMNFVQGGAAINTFCKQNNIYLKVVDAGVDYNFAAELPIIHAKIAYGTQNILKAPALTIDQSEKAMSQGALIVQNAVREGCNCIGFGEMGIGNTSIASMLMHIITKIPLENCVGAGTGMVGDKLIHKLTVLQKAVNLHNPSLPIEILSTFGGLEIAMMCGAYIEAYKQNMVILVDGFITTATLLVAQLFEPNITNNCIFSHVSNEQGHAQLLNFLQAKPLLSLGLRLGEGTGAAIAYPIIQSAITFLNNMSSFDDANVSNLE